MDQIVCREETLAGLCKLPWIPNNEEKLEIRVNTEPLHGVEEKKKILVIQK